MTFSNQQIARFARATLNADIRRILIDLEIKFEERKKGDFWYKCTLPTHKDHDASAHICSDTSSYRHGVWYCFGCNGAGNVIGLVRDWLAISFWEALQWVEARTHSDVVSPVRHKIKDIVIKMPPNFERYENPDQWNPPYLEYLYGRGITWTQIVKHQIGYCDAGKYARRVVIPVYLNGILHTWIARSIVGGKRVTSCKGGKPGLFGSKYALPRLGPAIVVEGWADALKLERLDYQNVMAIQTNTIHPSQFEYLRKFDYIILMPDGDSGGRNLIDSVGVYVEQKEFHVAYLPEDIDPAEADDNVIDRAIEDSKPWVPTMEKSIVEWEY